MDANVEMFDEFFEQPMVGNEAPAFKAQAYFKGWESAENPLGFKEVNLADHKGSWLMLMFYPLDFTFV